MDLPPIKSKLRSILIETVSNGFVVSENPPSPGFQNTRIPEIPIRKVFESSETLNEYITNNLKPQDENI